MNMKQERMKILNLLEEGKISADDADKLLRALSSFKSFETEDMAEEFQEKCAQFSQYVDGFANKLNEAYKDMEPTIKSVTRTVVEKTAAVVDNISQAIHESLDDMEQVNKEECNPNDPQQNNGAPCDSTDAEATDNNENRQN